jgi:uncharacterized membrane protein
MRTIRLAMMLGMLGLSSTALSEGLYVCNESKENISVAYASYESGIWVSHGWYSVSNQNCTALTDNFVNTRYYIYATSDSGKEWGANHRFCINMNAGFNIPYANNTQACSARNFFSVWIPDMVTGKFPDRYSVVIGPHLSGASNLGLNHPRAER